MGVYYNNGVVEDDGNRGKSDGVCLEGNTKKVGMFGKVKVIKIESCEVLKL